MKRRARILQRYFTPSERRLWSALDDGKLLGFEFVHQRPIGLVMVDFFCPKAQLAIDIVPERDLDNSELSKRERYLAKRGIHWLRFTEEEIQLYWLESLSRIRRCLRAVNQRQMMALN